jgi:hypothetical protein
MNMATQEQEAGVTPEVTLEEPVLEESAPTLAFDAEADDEIVGWLLISDGDQIVVPHPEGKTKQEVVEAFFKAKSKQHHAFQLGLGVYDPEVITTFAWSEQVQFPEIDKFDSMQERIELLMQATTELSQNQEILQQAQAQLFQEELEDSMGDEGEGDGEPEGFVPPALAPPVAPVPVARPVAGKRGFRPPGA